MMRAENILMGHWNACQGFGLASFDEFVSLLCIQQGLFFINGNKGIQ